MKTFSQRHYSEPKPADFSEVERDFSESGTATESPVSWQGISDIGVEIVVEDKDPFVRYLYMNAIFWG